MTGERQVNDNKNNSTKFMTGEQQINDNKNNSTKFMTSEQQANNRLITFIHNFIIGQSCKYF